MRALRRAVQLARELHLRYESLLMRLRVKKTAREAAQLAAAVLVDASMEQVLALHLNKGHRLICARIVSAGTLDASLIHSRDVIQAAIASGTAALVVVHHRPGGVIDPTAEDKRLAARLVREGELAGVTLQDFLIVNDGSVGGQYYSFRENGALS